MRIKLSNTCEFSRIVHGHWRLADWDFSVQDRLRFIEQVRDLGISTFDHADIYGDYVCEALLGEVLQITPGLRAKIQLVTKCGIKLISKNRPNHSIHRYDYSYNHLITSVEKSLSNFHTDYIDLLLLHRPAPFFDPSEVSRAFKDLHTQGKVLNFGVSNFNPMQYDMLEDHLDLPLVTNQVEISPFCLEHFENGNIDFFMKSNINPMAWSPLAGGAFSDSTNGKKHSIWQTILKIAEEHDVTKPEKIIYAWLLKHPANILPVVGSGKIERIKLAAESLDIEMTMDQWYEIYTAALGKSLP